MAFLNRFLIAALVLLPSQGTAAAEECSMSRILWATEQGDDRWIIYLDDTGHEYMDAFIELWRSKELAARILGTVRCSDGKEGLPCTFSVMDGNHPHPDRMSAAYESANRVSEHRIGFMWRDDGWKDDILVVDQFRETFSDSQNEHVETFMDLEGETLVPPTNYFTPLTCRKNEASIKPRYDVPFAGLWVKDRRFCGAIREAGGPEDLPFTFDNDYLYITHDRIKTDTQKVMSFFWVEPEEGEGAYRAYSGTGEGDADYMFYKFIHRGDELEASLDFMSETYTTWQRCE